MPMVQERSVAFIIHDHYCKQNYQAVINIIPGNKNKKQKHPCAIFCRRKWNKDAQSRCY